MMTNAAVKIPVALLLYVGTPALTLALVTPWASISRCSSSVMLRLSDESSFSNDCFPTIQTTNASKKFNQPSKADLYSDHELQNLLNIHNNLSKEVPGFNSNDQGEAGGPISHSLYDVILQTVQDIDGEEEFTAPDEGTAEDTDHQKLRFDSRYELDDFKKILPNIRAIASDVDGTLLSSKHTLHPTTKSAVQAAVEASFSPIHPLQYFFPATGKTRAGALSSLGPEIESLLQQVPGVYIQGVYCVDANGKVIFEKKLSRFAVEEAEALAQTCGVSVIAYDGDSLFATSSSNPKHVEQVNSKWGEPLPTVLQDSILNYEPCFHKILLMDDDTERLTTEVRPQLEELAAKLDCVVTQAIPTMLELLPAGCSKAIGVQKLCEELGLDLATQVCAVGDAENDLDMLRLAAIGVAVGNAAPMVKNAAAVVLEETNDDGGAGRAIELFGLGKAIELMDQ